MEFTVKKADLLDKLQLVQAVAEKKSFIPILGNLLLEANDDKVSLTGTDLELSVKASMPAKVKKDGKATVPARRLFEIVRTLPDDEIKFKALENNWVELRCQRSKFKLIGLDAKNFPSSPDFPSTTVRIPKAALATLIAKTSFAISSEESRYTLNGALLIVKNNSVTMVATDGTRLSVVKASHKIDGIKDELRVLVPKKALAQLKGLLAGEGEVELAKDESNVFFRSEDRVLIARLLTGQFPAYEAVLPKDNKNHVTIDRDSFTAAVRRASLVADPRTHAIKLSLSEGKAEIAASSSEYGEAREELTLPKPYGGQPLSIGFNATYLLDFLESAETGPVVFKLKDGESSVEMVPLAEEGCEYKHIIMPMRF